MVHFGSFWFILVHFDNWIHAIFGNITTQKTRKYFIETKIPIVYQNLFKSDREKIKSGKIELKHDVPRVGIKPTAFSS